LKAEITNNSICISESYDQKDFLKALGGKWNNLNKSWDFKYDLDTISDLNKWFPDLNIPLPELKPEIIRDDLVFFQQNLFNHQKESVRKGLSNKYFADLSEPGTGKTKTQIEIILQRNVWPILIICPVSLIYAVWNDELKKILPVQNIKILDQGTIKNKIRISTIGRKDVVVINYESVPMVEKELKEAKFSLIILDESTKIKNPKSQRSKSVIEIGREIEFRSIMTGTIAPNGLLDVFNQFKFLNPQLFGYSWYQFRERNFQKINDFSWIVKPYKLAEYKDKIRHCSTQHKLSDCTDMPELNHYIRKLPMPDGIHKVYQKAKHDLLLEVSGETIPLSFATTKLMKLRQVCSGFVYLPDEQSEFMSDFKIQEALDLIETINDRVIVFCDFRLMLEKAVEIIGAKYPIVKMFEGGSKEEQIDQFRRTENSVLIANPASAGHGLNLQFCSNIIYMTHSFDLEIYLQSKRRIERISQKNTMAIFHIIATHSIDEYIFKRLENKANLNEAIRVEDIISC